MFWPARVRLPFSGLLSCIVTTAMKEDSGCLTIDSGDGAGDGVMSADVRRYLCDVTCALLQQQSDPLPLCLLVARHAQLFTGHARILHKLHRFLPPKLLKVRSSCGYFCLLEFSSKQLLLRLLFQCHGPL